MYAPARKFKHNNYGLTITNGVSPANVLSPAQNYPYKISNHPVGIINHLLKTTALIDQFL